MLSQDIRDRITAAVDASFDRQLHFTAELVRHPSVRTCEGSAQDFLYEAMQSRGLAMDRWELDEETLKEHVGFGPVKVPYDGVTNVVGTYTPEAENGRSLILNGHVDVVPVGPEEVWSRSPWDAAVVDGWMYGRGSGDMKAGLAANLFAFDAVIAAGLAPTGRIHVQSVVEEECTGNGSLSALMRGYRADAVIIPEPEENMLVRANVGVIWFKVRVAGKPTHVREMSEGFNAIDAAYKVMEGLRQLEATWNADKDEHLYFENIEHPINFNFGLIQGGDWPSSVPAWCEFDVRAAIYPGFPAEKAWASISENLQDSALSLQAAEAEVTSERTGFFAEGYVLEEGSEAESVLERCHQQVFQTPLETFTTPGYLDGRVFTLYGNTPTLVYGPVSEAIHGFDERVNVESVRQITKSIALFIAEWCGVQEVSRQGGSSV